MFLDPTRGKRPMRMLIAGLVAFGLTACDDSKDAPVPDPPAEPEPEAPVEPQGIVPSHKARVKFKGGERYARDLAAALELPRDGLCTELGLYDCVGDVHRIALGGVEPYELGIDEPLPVSPVSASMAVDRTALAACTRRVEADFADPGGAVIFGALMTSTDRATREGVAADLVDRILRRDATADEVAALADFWETAEAESEQPAHAYGQLTCFAVATMLEALFY